MSTSGAQSSNMPNAQADWRNSELSLSAALAGGTNLIAARTPVTYWYGAVHP